MSDIRNLKKHLADIFDEGYVNPSDVDIFAQPEPYEYALSESVDSHEDYEFVDVDAIHAESLREYLLSNPDLYENQEDYESVNDFFDGYSAESPVIGEDYFYTSVFAMPTMQYINVYHFDKNRTLEDLDDQFAYFHIENNIKKFPESGSVKGDAFSYIYFFNSLADVEKLIMLMKLKFTSYTIKVNKNVTENKLAKVRMDAKSVTPKTDRPVHKSDTPEQIKANLKNLSKQFNVEVVDDFEDYTSNAKKKTDGETSLLSKSIREEHEYSSTLLDKYWRIFTEIATQSYPDTDPVEAMSAKYLSFDMDKLQAAANKYGYNHPMDFYDELDDYNELTEAPGAIRKGLAAVAMLAGLWGVNNHLAQQAYESSPQLQELTAYLEVAKEYNDTRMIAQLEDRIKNHKMRLDLGKGDVMGPDGRPIDVVYDKSIKEDTDIPFHTCPKCGGEIFYEGEGKKDACYHKVKSRYKVWPSAYASGALVQCRKVGAKNWGEKSKK